MLSCEKTLINKNYDEYEGENLWNFYKKYDKLSQITLRIDLFTNNYIFSFPLNNSKYNYQISFPTMDEAKKYIEYVVENYL